MYCSKCGSLIGEGEQFCKQCGQRVGEVPSEGSIASSKVQVAAPSKKRLSGGMIVLMSVVGFVVAGLVGMSIFILANVGSETSMSTDQQTVLTTTETPEETTHNGISEAGMAEAEVAEPVVAQQTKEEKTEKNEGMPQGEEEFKASCQYYYYDDLARNPKNYIGEPVILYGEVVQVMEDGSNVELRVDITECEYGFEDTIYVTYTRKSPNESRILEDDIITLWGISNDTISYETVLGSSLTIPYVEAAYIEQGVHPQIYGGDYNSGNEMAWEAGYILPYSDTVYLTDADVMYLSDVDLRLARNEIYARHGRMFTSEDLQVYFGSQSWYIPSIPADGFTDEMLSEVEKYNVDLIKSYEAQFN